MKIQIQNSKGCQIGMTIPYNLDKELKKGDLIKDSEGNIYIIKEVSIQDHYILITV